MRSLLILLLLDAPIVRSREQSEEAAWRTISVYVGREAARQARKGSHSTPESFMDADKPGKWHSQGSQDQIIAALFPKMRHSRGNGGYFVDLAANHPLFISNTRALERDYGWNGLCIDAAEHLVADLARRRTCTVVNAVLSTQQDDVVTFRAWLTSGWQTGLSGIVGTSGENRADGGGGVGSVLARYWTSLLTRFWKPQSVPTEDRKRVATTFGAILDHFHAPRVIDYLSLDVEGAEMMVLSGFPFGRCSFRAMTLERPSRDLQTLLMAHNYSYVRHLDMTPGSDLDQLWLHESMLHRRDAVLQRACAKSRCIRERLPPSAGPKRQKQEAR